MRILVFGEALVHILAKASPEHEVDFFLDDGATNYKKRCGPVTDFTFKHIRPLRKKICGGGYDFVLSQSIRYPVVRREVFKPYELIRAFVRMLRKPQVYASRVLPWLVRGVDIPIAVVCREDYNWISAQNHALLRACHCYFKRELPVNKYEVFLRTTRKLESPNSIIASDLYALCAKLHPISLGLPAGDWSSVKPADGKQTDIFFAGRPLENGARDSARQAELLDLKRDGFKIEVTNNKLPTDEFLQGCARAWITWSPQGLGWDCWRHYEAAAVGSVPLTNYPSICRHAPLLDGVHTIFYGNEAGQLRETAKRALANKERLRAMGSAAQRHVLENHTQQKLMNYIISTTLEAFNEQRAKGR